MNVPFLDLKAQYHALKDEIHAAIGEVMENTAFAGGPFVAGFEKEFAKFCDCKHAIGVGNGTDALWLSLLALGIGPGDEVITVPNTFIATAEADHLLRGKAGLRGRRREDLQHESRPSRGRHHPQDQGDHPRPPVRSDRGHGPHPGHRQGTWPAGGRRRLPGPRRRVQGPEGRLPGRHRLLQLLSGEEPGRLRRGRRRRDERRRARREDAGCSGTTASRKNITTA